MPALTFLAVVGLVLVGLLFVADATLENGHHRSSPVTALVCPSHGVLMA
ncbi:MAG: hypothetical protein WBV66_14370 [Pseudolabrys sp.]